MKFALLLYVITVITCLSSYIPHHMLATPAPLPTFAAPSNLCSKYLPYDINKVSED
jgi:hypothetical protein